MENMELIAASILLDISNNLMNYRSKIIKLVINFNNYNELYHLNEYTNLKILICSNMDLREIKNIPENLHYLNISNNKLKKIPYLPKLLFLDCSHNELEELDLQYLRLVKVNCSYNKIRTINVNNDTVIKHFNCSNNKLEQFLLNIKVQFLDVSNNEITKMIIPELVQKLNCEYNKILKLHLTKYLTSCNCSYNHLNKLIIDSDLTNTLKFLDFSNNHFKSYPIIPIHASSNNINEVDVLYMNFLKSYQINKKRKFDSV
jgi:hypothetical protein